MAVDHNGFMLGAGGSAALPDWQPDRVKQAQRLRKWRNMLGGSHPLQCAHPWAAHAIVGTLLSTGVVPGAGRTCSRDACLRATCNMRILLGLRCGSARSPYLSPRVKRSTCCKAGAWRRGMPLEQLSCMHRERWCMREGVAWLGSVAQAAAQATEMRYLARQPVKGCLLCSRRHRQRHGRLEAVLGAAPGHAQATGVPVLALRHRQRHGRLEALLGAAPGHAEAARAQVLASLSTGSGTASTGSCYSGAAPELLLQNEGGGARCPCSARALLVRTGHLSAFLGVPLGPAKPTLAAALRRAGAAAAERGWGRVQPMRCTTDAHANSTLVTQFLGAPLGPAKQTLCSCCPAGASCCCRTRVRRMPSLTLRCPCILAGHLAACPADACLCTLLMALRSKQDSRSFAHADWAPAHGGTWHCHLQL